MEIGNQQLMCDTGAYSIADAITLVAHHYDALLRQLLSVDVFSVEECAINRETVWKTIKERLRIDIYNMYAGYAAHRGLNHFGIPSVDSAQAAINGIDTKPIGDTDNGAKITWILYIIKQ